VSLVVGLGNPGARYEPTRHNLGFSVVERLRSRGVATPWRARYAGAVCELRLDGRVVSLLRPETYMNSSGVSVARALLALGLHPSELLVVHDELDLPFGRLRLKRGGGDGGHNGLRSIAEALGETRFARLRVGIGRPPAEFVGDTADFVLQAFAPPERDELDPLLDRAADAVLLTVRDGLDSAMNVVNQRA
jgi:PTH1 family peptidyl-tRNA hydrolase